MSDNGTMFWPATTTTAIIDPTSREILPDILNKKVSVGVAGNISATVLPPIILESISINSTNLILDSSSVGNVYYLPDTKKIRYVYSITDQTPTSEDTDPSPELIYYDKETDKFYRWDATTQGMINIVSEEPTFLDIDLADLESETISTFLTNYYPSSEEDPLPSSTFEDNEGKYKNIILRIRVLEEDNPEGITSEYIDEDYWNFSIKLTPLTLETADNAWNDYGNFLFGSYTYYGTTYSAFISKFDNSYYYYIQKIKLENLGIITSLSAYEDVPIYPTTGDDINIAFGKINRIVQSHEEVTARALLDLNSRIQNLSERGGGIQEITWSALKTLRDGGNLTPGQLYRITDYTCTTTQTDTQSAGHTFDVIVLALSESTLNETAWAEHHEGDTYFEDCKLEAWELKYCLDNDTTRFKWADTTNGKGIIYWMKDEWENECPYDFKNIQFKRQLTDGSLDTTSGTNTWCYTFNYWNSTTSASEDLVMYNLTSYTQYGQTDYIAPCIRNKLGKTVTNYQTTPFTNYNIILSNIVFLCTEIAGDSCRDNYFEDQCHNITFGNRCYYNILKNNCSNITFGDYCSCNNFSERSNFITLGESCREINGKENISNINIADNCSYVSIGASCHFITLSKNYTCNLTVGDGNQHITITSSLTTTNSGTGALRKIYIAPHTNITSTTKTISHNSLGDTFLTTYKPANSVEISV